MTLLWTTRRWATFEVHNGYLFDIGAPSNVEWYAEGRPATRTEVEASIESGLPSLQQMAEAEGIGAVSTLNARRAQAEKLLPKS